MAQSQQEGNPRRNNAQSHCREHGRHLVTELRADAASTIMRRQQRTPAASRMALEPHASILAWALFALIVFATHTQSLHAYPPIIHLRIRATIHNPASLSIQSEEPTISYMHTGGRATRPTLSCQPAGSPTDSYFEKQGGVSPLILLR